MKIEQGSFEGRRKDELVASRGRRRDGGRKEEQPTTVAPDRIPSTSYATYCG
jgi:hypothetical protein